MTKAVKNMEITGTNTGDQLYKESAKQRLIKYLSILQDTYNMRDNEIILPTLVSHKTDSNMWKAAIYVNGVEIVLSNTAMDSFPGKTDEEIENACIEELMEFFFTTSLYYSFRKKQHITTKVNQNIKILSAYDKETVLIGYSMSYKPAGWYIKSNFSKKWSWRKLRFIYEILISKTPNI